MLNAGLRAMLYGMQATRLKIYQNRTKICLLPKVQFF